jgi:hypothetical protein
VLDRAISGAGCNNRDTFGPNDPTWFDFLGWNRKKSIQGSTRKKSAYVRVTLQADSDTMHQG